MVVNSCYFLVVVFVCFPSVEFVDGRLPVLLWMYLTSLGWSVLSTTFCRAGFVARHCLNLVLS